MSGDVTDRFPDGPRDTAPILEQIVAELRALREEVGTLREESHGTRVAVEDLGARMDRLEAEIRALKGGPAS